MKRLGSSPARGALRPGGRPGAHRRHRQAGRVPARSRAGLAELRAVRRHGRALRGVHDERRRQAGRPRRRPHAGRALRGHGRLRRHARRRAVTTRSRSSAPSSRPGSRPTTGRGRSTSSPTAARASSFARRSRQDPSLKVEDVVTLGTPNRGATTLSQNCGTRPVCKEMAFETAVVTRLPETPQGAGGTDWSVIASGGDDQVPAGVRHRHRRRAQDALRARRAVARRPAERRLHHRRRQDRLLARRGPLDRVEPRAALGGARRRGSDLRRRLHRGRVRRCRPRTPSSAASTPVILLPGFGASELDCSDVASARPTCGRGAFDRRTWAAVRAGDSTARSPLRSPGRVHDSIGPTGNAL